LTAVQSEGIIAPPHRFQFATVIGNYGIYWGLVADCGLRTTTKHHR